jgi:alkanesulfonate monooxygenase
VFPLLPLEHGATDKLPGQKLTGPFGEVIGNHFVPKASAS